MPRLFKSFTILFELICKEAISVPSPKPVPFIIFIIAVDSTAWRNFSRCLLSFTFKLKDKTLESEPVWYTHPSAAINPSQYALCSVSITSK